MSNSEAFLFQSERARRLIDGTWERLCGNADCNNGKWFTPKRRDAVYCSGNCRLIAHRERERLNALEVEKAARYRKIVEHREDWIDYLSKHLTPNSRPSRESLGKLYAAMIEDRRINGPWDQMRLGE